ncbi:MAG: hypothetical protein ACLSWS_21660 [Faecalispora jeddahensis]
MVQAGRQRTARDSVCECAVDPAVISLGSTIMIEHNGEMLYLRADDTGPAIGKQAGHCGTRSSEALSLGVKTADIWW